MSLDKNQPIMIIGKKIYRTKLDQDKSQYAVLPGLYDQIEVNKLAFIKRTGTDKLTAIYVEGIENCEPDLYFSLPKIDRIGIETYTSEKDFVKDHLRKVRKHHKKKKIRHQTRMEQLAQAKKEWENYANLNYV